MKKLLVFLCVLSLVLGFAGVSNANLNTNGSFEDNQDIGNYLTLGGGGTDIPGWTISAGSVDWVQDYWTASDGTKSLDLAGLQANGSILSTSLATTPSDTYLVQFDMAGNPDSNSNKALIAANVLGIPHVFTFNQGGNTNQNMGGETKSSTFTATYDNIMLAFGNDSNNPDESYGAAPDNVGIDLDSDESVPGSIPKPATMLLVGSGLIGLAGMRRKIFKP